MIEIACSADEPYLPHVSAMLHSLLAHTGQRPLRIWLMHGADLPDEGKARVRTVADSFGATLEFLQVPKEKLAGYPTERFHYSCWYRILLPELLPQLDRILYLDCDVIVTDDLQPLWNTDLRDNIFGAVPNPLLPPLRNEPKRQLGLENPLDYLNSGILLMDLDAMRKEDLSLKLKEYAIAHPQNNWPEQDALSVLMRGRWLRLHPRWNAQSTFYDLPASDLPYPESIVYETVERPAIIHFNGPFKPWQYLCKHPLRNLYFDHLERTQWPRKPLEYAGLGYRLIGPFSVSMQYWILWKVQPALLFLPNLLERVFKRIVRQLRRSKR